MGAGVAWALSNLASIEAEAGELSESDPAEAERFFGNRIVAGGGAWMPRGRWEGAWARSEEHTSELQSHA